MQIKADSSLDREGLLCCLSAGALSGGTLLDSRLPSAPTCNGGLACAEITNVSALNLRHLRRISAWIVKGPSWLFERWGVERRHTPGFPASEHSDMQRRLGVRRDHKCIDVESALSAADFSMDREGAFLAV
jgi:hypothetical protein